VGQKKGGEEAVATARPINGPMYHWYYTIFLKILVEQTKNVNRSLRRPVFPPLPAAEMRAAIHVEDVTGHCRGVGQVQDRIGDVLNC
jgi:hypothetical protein